MDTSKMIKAYCLKTKEKNVPLQDAVIKKTAKGGYMAAGHDGKGNKMAHTKSRIMNNRPQNCKLKTFYGLINEDEKEVAV